MAAPDSRGPSTGFRVRRNVRDVRHCCVMPPYRHVFVCENLREADNPKGCCSAKGSPEIRERLKKLAYDAGLKGKVRINKAGCLGPCAQGVSVVVYPEGVWYGRVTMDDVDELFREHVLAGRPVERLRTDSRPDDDDPA